MYIYISVYMLPWCISSSRSCSAARLTPMTSLAEASSLRARQDSGLERELGGASCRQGPGLQRPWKGRIHGEGMGLCADVPKSVCFCIEICMSVYTQVWKDRCIPIHIHVYSSLFPHPWIYFKEDSSNPKPPSRRNTPQYLPNRLQ